MILSLQALAPAALLLAGGLWLLVRPGANVFVLVQLLTLGALARLYQLTGAGITVPLYSPLPDVPLDLRLDAYSLFFATVAVGAAFLVSLPWINDRERRLPFGWLVLAEFGAVGAILAGDLPGLAVGWGVAVAALLMLVLVPDPAARELRRPSEAVTRTLVLHLGAAAVLLAGVVGVEALAGTTAYDAIPVGALDTRTGLLLAASPVLVLATLAGVIRACRRPATAAVMICGVLLPLAVYVMVRTFDLAEGRPLPPLVNSALVLGGGLGAVAYGLYALWSPDLGSALARLLNGLGLLLVAAFGVGGAGGLVALLVGFVALEVCSAAALLLLDGGAGRLPGRGPLPGWGLALVALLPLASVLGLGLGLDARLLLARRLFDQGLLGVVLTIPMILAVVVIGLAAVAGGRFGGGTLIGRRRTFEVILAAALPLAAQLAAPALIDRLAVMAAQAAHASAADVRSTTAASIPGTALGAGFLLAAVVAVAGLAAAGLYSATDGLRGAPDLLPPRSAVAPEIAARRAVGLGAARARAVAAGFRPHGRWVFVACWAVALGALVLGAR